MAQSKRYFALRIINTEASLEPRFGILKLSLQHIWIYSVCNLHEGCGPKYQVRITADGEKMQWLGGDTARVRSWRVKANKDQCFVVSSQGDGCSEQRGSAELRTLTCLR